MKLISFNVNGIKSAIDKGLLDFIKQAEPHAICLQETKSPKKQPPVSLPGYQLYWNYAQKAGYSGTAIFTRIKPVAVTYGIGIEKHDQEGRVITAEFDDFILVCVYVPNAKRKLERLEYRVREWDVDFLKYLKKLEALKPVVFCGDLNVAHQEIDLANPKANVKNHGFTPEERAGFDNIVKKGFIDTFREFEKDGGHYTWWSPMNNCRDRNIGWRIDYFMISAALRPRLKSARILPDVTGSDHCPVEIELK
ncbi:MAG: exodeoxyribonuclease III [Candidatus Omnitrophica bacterium]|nr:exodeoxyribonuclease III [Candidatus Omnitrophota bacterium]MCB9722205.1 exodeoxyribonuclease III [Candidatus Omnitrophota bacterium]